MKSKRAQMIVELVLSLPIWICFLGGFLTLSRVVIHRQRSHMLARFGTMLQSTGRVDDDVVRKELTDFSARFDRSQRTQWNFEIGRFDEIPAARFYQLVKTRVRANMDRFDWPLLETVVVQREETGE